MTRMFKVIEHDCCKRQSSEKEVYPVNIEIPDYQPTPNYICNMIANYSDGSIKKLIARVVFNEFINQWLVDAKAVTVRVIENGNAHFEAKPDEKMHLNH